MPSSNPRRAILAPCAPTPRRRAASGHVQSSAVPVLESDRRAPGHRRHRALVAALGLVLAVALAACSGGTTDPSAGGTTDPTTVGTAQPTGPRRGGTLTVAVGALPTSWSPAGQAWTTDELQAARGVYDWLATYDADDQPQPELARSFDSNADYTIWTIRLRPGITFHDGTPFDAAAVVANLEAQRHSAVAAALLQPVTAVAAVDPLTVQVTMSSSWSTFPQVLATQVGAMASPTTLAAPAGTPPVGTGPFRWSAATATDTVLVRNDHYWKAGLPLLDGVRFTVVPEPAARVDAVVAGTADLTSVEESGQLVRVSQVGDKAIQVLDDPNAEQPKVAIALDTGRPPFDHISARRAVALATDRKALVSKVFDGQASVAKGILSDTSPWFGESPDPARDLDGAKQQVAAYEKETGQPLAFTLLVPPNTEIAHVASLWRVQLTEAGIDVTLSPVSPTDLALATLTGQYQAALEVGFSSPHPDLYEPQFRGSPSEQPVVNPDVTRYVNPLVTKAFADARATSDVAQQVDAYRIVQEQLLVDVPWLFLVQLPREVIARPDVRDATSWTTASGSPGRDLDGATVSLAQIWLDR